MTSTELLRLFYEDPPILLKGLQDVIGAYTIDVFETLPNLCIVPHTAHMYVYFYPHLFYDQEDEFFYRVPLRLSQIIRPDLIGPRKRGQLSRAFLYQYIREHLDDVYVFKTVDMLAKHIRRIFKGPTYGIRLSHGQRVVLTEPFFAAMLRRIDRTLTEFNYVVRSE